MAYKTYFQNKTRLGTTIAVIVVLISAGAYLYQSRRSQPELGQEELRPELTPYAHLFVFENKDPNLPDVKRDEFFQRFVFYTNTLRRDPDNFGAWLGLGQTHKLVNDFEKAHDSWAHLGDISPLNSISFGNLGDLYAWFLHDLQKAEDAYLQAIKNEPDDINYRRNLAEIYAKLIFPDSIPAQQEKIVPLLEEGVKGAEAEVEKAELTALLASYWRDWGDKKTAVELYREALKIDSEYPKKDIIAAEIDRLIRE